MFSGLLKITLAFTALILIAVNVSGMEINKDTYDIYLGDVDDDGDKDFYFAQKPWVLILHGDISTPIVMPPTKNFIVYNNFGTYAAPQSFTMSATTLASKISSGKLRLAVFNSDYFILNSTANNYTLLLRGADEYTPGLLIKSYSNVDFPTTQDVTTLSINSYDGISNRNIQLIVKDINRDGLNDIFLTKSDGSEYAYVTDNNSIPARFFEVTPSSIASIDKTRSLPAEFDVTSGGQATYKIPVMTAPGSAGLVPNVSLNYSSGGGNGLMGLGWSLSAYGAISRCRQTEGVDGVAKAITWTSEDRFCLNGDRLLLASGTYGAAGSTYKTEIDSFARITAVGGTTGHPDSFTVEYKDGTIETYGNTTDSANSKNQLSSSNSNTVLDWALSKRSDSAGNKIIYTYTKDSDGQRINTIDFAYGTTTTRNAYLQFNYDSRNDPISGYVAGHAYKTGKRLSSVRSYNGSTEIRSYIITYNQGTAATTNDKLSRVNKVQECVGTVCAPATEFEWELPDYQLAATTSTKTFPSGISVHAMGDFNGDGLQDIVWFDQAVGGTYENAGLLLKRPLRYAYGKIDTNGNFSFENQNFTNNTDMGPRLNSRSIKVQDVNNDGRMDIVVDNEYKPSHSQFYKNYEVYLSLPMPDGTWRLSDTKSTTHTIPYQVLDQPLAVIEPDINGDGISDIIAWPIGDLPWDSETFGQYPAPYISLKNFSGGYTPKNLNHILGNPSLTAGITYEYLPDANFTNNMHTAPILRPISMYGDFNGDGAVDVVADVWQSYSGCGIRDDDGNRWCDSRGDGTVIYTMRRLSSGDYELHYHSSSVGLLYDGWDFAVDLNNDGLADIVSRHLTAGWGISINTGADLTTLQYSGVPKNPLNIFVPQGNHDSAIADINGDGYQDFVWQKPLNAASLIGSSEIKVKYWDPATNQFEAQERTLGSLPYKVIVNYNSATPRPDPRQSNVPRFKTDRFNMTDVNGDGVSDLITLPNTQTNDSVVTVRLGVNTKKNTNKIVKITSGLGDEKKIQYGRVNESQHYSRIDGIKASGGLEQVCEDTVYNEGGIHEYTQQNCWNILTGSVDATAFYQEISNPWHSLRPEEQSLRPASPVLEAFGPMSVVTDVETTAPGASSSSPNNISNSTAKLSYFYGHAKMQAGGRGFLGFKYFTVVNRETGVRTETEYRQDWPFIGQARQINTFTTNGHKLSEQFNTWGLVNCHDTSGTPNSTCVANLGTQVDNSGTGALGAVKPFLRTSITKTYALKDNGSSQGDEISTSTEGNIYDSNGNVARTDSTVSSGSALGLPTLSKTTVNTYNYSGSTWSMQQGRLQSMTVSANEPTYGTITRTSDFTYYTSGAAIGLLNTETVEPNNSAFTVTTTHYYDKGNRYKSVTTADGQTRQSEVAYDNLGRYVDNTYGFFTNGTAPDTPIRQLVSQVVSRDKYSTPTEMRSYVSSSNYVTKKVFTKAFGTPYRTEDSTGAFAEIKTGFGIDAYGVCPSDNKIWQTTEAAGGALGIECRDVLGRVRRTGSLGFDGSDWSLVDNEYDKLSRVLRTSKPYWKKSSERYWTSQTYDLLGRVTETRAPYKNTYATTTTAYTNLEVRITNPKNQVRIEKRDLAGQVYEVIDPNNGTTAFAYDARGNMRVMRDPAANTTTVAYDLRDRKTSMSDPDKGNWTYKYNRFGDLVCQLDGKGQTSVQRYDIAGRMFSRTDRLAGGDCNNPTGAIDKYSQWNYDTAANGLGQLASVYDSLTTTGAAQYQQTYSYDNLGRVSGTTTTMPGHAGAVGSHYESVTYDQYGRVDKTYDAARTSASFTTNGIQNLYNAQGYLYKVVDATAANQASYYTINQMNASGAVTNALYGNGVTQAADYYPQTGLTKTLRADRSLASLPIQDIELDWDEVGNLAWRHETGTASDSVRRNIRESFGYDSLNRLNTWTSSGDLAASETANYNNVDNITNKTGIGNYLYGGQCGAGTNAGPHALCRAGSTNYYYDRNGNMLSDSAGRTMKYTSYDLPSEIIKGSHKTEFSYGPSRARYKRVDTSGSQISTTLYLGSVEKVYYWDGTIQWKRNIAGVAQITQTVNSSGTKLSEAQRYFIKDHLGSIGMITDEIGYPEQTNFFDPWGRERKIITSSSIKQWLANNDNYRIANKPITTRGFTGHEQLAEVGLIHMNGRIYDGALGRFVQADPIIQDPLRVQSLNRYSYVWNNPLNATDPSGFTKCEKTERGEQRCTSDDGKNEVTTGKDSCSSGKCQNYQYKDKDGKNHIISINKKDMGAFEKNMAPEMSKGAYSNSAGAGNGVSSGDSYESRAFDFALGRASAEAKQAFSQKLDFIEQRRKDVISKGGRGYGAVDSWAANETASAVNKFICENAGCGIEPVDPTLAVGLVYGGVKLTAAAFTSAIRQRAQASLVTDTAGSIRNVNSINGSMNCVNCVVATDATLAGRAASALPGGPYRISILEKLFGSQFSSPTSIDNIAQTMSLAGPGARGIIFGSRGGNVGHVFNVTNQKGKINFLDGQTGGSASLEGYKAFQLLRTN